MMATSTIIELRFISSKHYLLSTTRFSHFCCRSLSFPPTRSVTFELKEQQQQLLRIDTTKLRLLKQNMDALGIKCDESSTPGRYCHLLCPKCRGGQSLQRSLSLHICQDGNFAMWRCFHSKCGWAGKAFAEGTCNGISQLTKVKSSEQLTVESLGLKPLGEKILSYFRERKISEETLWKNAIMQLSVDQVVIAFTYRKDGLLVGCKYRTMEKKFWQEKGTDKILYGVDDIKEAADIIIVEGEIDKLSVDEAGFHNCVSVPCGAPQIVSTKELPSLEKDTAFQYLWNCKDYLDKASRILLATDGDTPGHALAEELARRLGKDRCWRVRWPKKDEFSCYKDANEVLKNLGAVALREVIENAELYEEHVSNQL